jgi:hypothetical protein
MSDEDRSRCQPAHDDPWHDRQARSGERETPLEGHQPFTGDQPCSDEEPPDGEESDRPTNATGFR